MLIGPTSDSSRRLCCVRPGQARELAVGHDQVMSRGTVTPPVPVSEFVGFRFPPEVTVLVVRWYLRFALSYRDVEELLAERGRGQSRHGLPVGAALHAPAR